MLCTIDQATKRTTARRVFYSDLILDRTARGGAVFADDPLRFECGLFDRSGLRRIACQIQFLPHTVVASATQMPSQAVVVQNGSTAPTIATQLADAGGVSQPGVSAAPVEHRVWPQVPCEAGQIRLFVTLCTALTQLALHAVVAQDGSAAAMLAI
jgi:hypothetical protein